MEKDNVTSRNKVRNGGKEQESQKGWGRDGGILSAEVLSRIIRLPLSLFQTRTHRNVAITTFKLRLIASVAFLCH